MAAPDRGRRGTTARRKPDRARRLAFDALRLVNGEGAYANLVLADLLAYERRANPDGQVQFVGGKPVDALSNPFSLNVSGYGLLADPVQAAVMAQPMIPPWRSCERPRSAHPRPI